MNSDKNKLHYLAIPGSLREASLMRHLMRALQQIGPENMAISIFDLHDIPFYHQDIEDEVGFPPGVQAFRYCIAKADGLIFDTPEYYGSVPGVLKNSID